MQNLTRKAVLLKDVSKERLDELFEHNESVKKVIDPPSTEMQ